MDDLISRQTAIGAICTEGTRLERNGTVAMAEIKQWCVDILEALPPAQPKIIYCKDCKHYVLRALFGRSQGMCERLCKYDNSFSMLTEDDDFCSYAEKA